MHPNPNDMLLEFAGEVGERVMAAIGKRRVRSVFVAGSVAKREAVGLLVSGQLEIYSDVDLYVVVDGDDIDDARRRARQVADDVPRHRSRLIMVPRPDVGLYSLADLMNQPARPGTVDIHEHHVVLHGDEEVPRRTAAIADRGIPSIEALYLLENRLNELARIDSELDGAQALASDETGCLERYRRYVVVKSFVDIATAVLIVAGRYHSLRTERVERFLTGADASLVSERCRSWVAEAQHAADDPRRLLRSEDIRRLQENVAESLTQVWRSIARRLREAPDGDWRDLLQWRCAPGRRTGVWRELWVLHRRSGRGAGQFASTVWRLNGFAPLSLLRLSGLLQVLAADANKPPPGVERIEAALDALTRSVGFTEGGVYRRGLDAYRTVS